MVHQFLFEPIKGSIICERKDKIHAEYKWTWIEVFLKSSKVYDRCNLFSFVWYLAYYTGKSFSEALILASTNPQYDKRLFIELQVQYMKIASSEHVVYINCSECQNKKHFMYTTCSELVIFMYWTRNSMNNFLSYCGLVDARISPSEKYLPVPVSTYYWKYWSLIETISVLSLL